MKNLKKLTLLVFLSLIFFLTAFGQESDKDITSLIDRIGNEISQDSIGRIDFIAAPDGVENDSALQAKYFESIKAYYDYRVNGFRHRHAVFQWQLYSSKIVFIAVIFLLVSGIVFSGIQFWKGLRNNQIEMSSIEAMPTGLKVSSPVLGVIVLVISLLFFYLYLVYIFPVHETF